MQNTMPRQLSVVWVRSGGYQLCEYLCSPVLGGNPIFHHSLH